MQARAHKTRRLMAFFDAVAEPVMVWAWKKWVARRAIGSGPTVCTQTLIETLAPMPAAARGAAIVVSVPLNVSSAAEVVAADTHLPVVLAASGVGTPAEAVDTGITPEAIVEAPVNVIAAEQSACVEDFSVEIAPELSAAVDASPASTAELQMEAPHSESVASEIIATEPEAAEIEDAEIADVIEPSKRSDFGLAARMAIVGTMNAPASRASKRTRQVAPAGRPVPVQKPITLKVRRSNKLPKASASSVRKIRTSAEVIDLASVRDVPNASLTRQAA